MGEVVTVKTSFNEGDEANFVVGDILMGVNRGRRFGTQRCSTE